LISSMTWIGQREMRRRLRRRGPTTREVSPPDCVCGRSDTCVLCAREWVGMGSRGEGREERESEREKSEGREERESEREKSERRSERGLRREGGRWRTGRGRQVDWQIDRESERERE
jgi:hypothetical protein